MTDRRDRQSRPYPSLRRRIALGAAVVMVGTLLQGVAGPAAAVDDGTGRPGLPVAETPVAGTRVTGGRAEPLRLQRPGRAPHAIWPTAQTVRIPLTGTATTARTADTSLPVRVDTAVAGRTGTAAGTIEARMASRPVARAAGVEGPLFTLRPDGAAAVGLVRAHLDYAPFAEVFGGGYASRLTLVELPACALTTPDRTACRTAKPLPTTHDRERKTLTAPRVTLRARTATVLAATTTAAGDKGDYQATSLSPSATWNVSLNTGDFSWNYGLPVPQVPGGLLPAVGLSYASGSVDGRTATTNNQSSWAGDGFSLWPGSIERRYKPCADDGVKNADGFKPGDLCWSHDNAYISFNGKAGELVPTGADTFKLREDDGTKIDRLTSVNRGNGDNDGEYWRVTTPDGSRYYFGYHRLPGWTEGKETTDSAWTVPVYGDDAGEECKGTTFATSWCQQAWRWNLDYAVDPHGNALAYYYTKETNHYGRNLEPKDNTPYVRGGTLDRIEYGLRSSSMYGTQALARVRFTSAERCLPLGSANCRTIDTQSSYWYDTPWDLNCAAGATCDQGRVAPAFFTRKLLTDVTTEVLDGTAYEKADSWKLTHDWGMADTDYQLRLRSIQRTGHSATPAITLPPTTLGYTQLANRLDKTGDGYAPFIKDRLSSVADESGGQIDATYSAPACSWTALPTPETNTTRCFPQYTGGSETDDPTLQWFNKYVTTAVTETDRTGGAPDKVTAYDYLGGGAWHYDDDDGLTKEKHKTWSQWRGYGQVRTQSGGQGGAAALRTQQDSYFLRGMDGDRLNRTGGTKSATATLDEGEGAPITDHESAAGFGYKTVQFSGPGGKVLAKTINRPWRHETARKVRDWGTVTANFTGTAESRTLTSLDNGAGASWRTVSTATTYDTVAGRITEVDDKGNHSTASDNVCTRTTYAATAATDTVLTSPARVETVARPCGTAPARPADVISDIRTAYDGQPYGTPPTKGLATASAALREYEGTTAVYLESGGTFDSYGRPVTTTDLTNTVRFTAAGDITRVVRSGRTTVTERSPAIGFTTTLTLTNPPTTAGDPATAHTSTTTFDRLRGLPLTQTDTNGKVTTFAYDALGRSSKVWLADRHTGQLPNHAFSYTHAADKRPIAVGTTTLGNRGVPRTSYTLYDGFLRPRQTQTPGPGGGSLISDTFYGERGLTTKEFASYYATGAPGTTLFQPANALSVETQTHYTYDGLNRQTEVSQIAGNSDGGQVLNTTKTLYGGDRTTVIPPTGGTATTTLTDARGRTTELRQHHQPTADAPYDTTRYAYTARGEIEKITGPTGNAWSYGYDLLGRQILAKDPDKGTTTSTYDDRGQLLTTTNDATGKTLAYAYDGIGRKTQLREGSATGTLRAEWEYDTVTGAKGHPARSTRYENGHAYSSRVDIYDRLYRPLRTSVTIPATEGKLAGTYTSATSYLLSGAVQAIGYPTAGALPASAVSFTYEDDTLRPIALGDSQGVQANTSYSLTGKPLQHELFAGTGKKTWVTNGYEWGTQRLSTTRVDREDVAGVDQSNTYRYDDAGNVRSVTDVSRSGTDSQCFTYDWARRLTQAWTQSTATCATAPTGTNVGGPAPYWHSYTYNPDGGRSTEILHDTKGNTARNITRSYEYPLKGEPQPHALTSVSSAGPVGTPNDSFVYRGGYTVSRTVDGTPQNLEWDPEGHLAKVTEPVASGPDKITRYLYDTEGNRLIARTPTETTLYLGTTEITLPKGTTATPEATRYLALGGGHQAVQENDGSVSFTLADHHGTAGLAVNAATQALTQRRTLPFGGPRGTEPRAWPGTKGFVGGTDDTKSTGLTHLGAREYDPSTGRFISVDPLLEADKPQTLNGYTYAAQNPLTFTDPTGLGLGCGPHMMADCPKNDPNGDGVVNPGYPNTNRPIGGGGKTAARPPSSNRPPVIQRDRDSVVIHGQRIPTQTELMGIMKHSYHERLGYQRNLENWARSACMGQTSDFCVAADGLGWFGNSPDMDVLEVLGVRDYVDCAQGDGGGSCKRAAGDAVITAVTSAAGKVAKAAFKLVKANLKRKKAVPASCLFAMAGNSFKAGTLVLMADGTTKPIEEVRVGDEVLATDPETGLTSAQKVTAELVHRDDDLLDVHVRTEDGDRAVINTTAHHAFWDLATRSWKPAGALTGESRLTAPSGGIADVTGSVRRPGTSLMYDLSISAVRTYYVLAGTTPVLVHNCGTADPHSFKRTEALSGNASKRNVDNLTSSMKQGGWQGDPIKVAQHGGELYVLDGHHRVAAAKRAGVEVPYRIVSEDELLGQYSGGIDDVVTAWAEVGPDRLVNRHKKPGYR
ncbi:RHS repeat-associated core domain-containing protein [Streptomyces sp. NPDC057638]|uniref:RHS repeat-associated core domain-containing protein n=1 Tax=Streptomyces sp. NPDC057638 TaxID=3346190 RepID=UPI00368FB89F